MQWEDRQESENVEDRRGMGAGAKAGIAAGGGGLLILILALLFGADPKQLGAILGQPKGGGGGGQGQKREFTPEEEKQAKFTRVILKDTEDVWTKLFAERGQKYEKPVLVLFAGEVDSACGFANAAVGPFYCPGDHRLYIDLDFYKDMSNKRKLDAPGEFARAYVVAHEVGHHVQNLLGYSQIVDRARKSARENEMSVRLELQADYLAGVWAHHIQEMHKNKYDVLKEDDIKSGMKAAFEIGDDRLQKKGMGYVVPEKFTHGKSAARMHWLLDGIKTGDFGKEKLDSFFKKRIEDVDVGKSQ